MVHLRLTIGYLNLKATVVHIRVKLDHLSRVTIGYFFSISKHKAIKTELHPKVRQTCLHENIQMFLRQDLDDYKCVPRHLTSLILDLWPTK